MIRDWHALWLVRRGHKVHAYTDPACRFYEQPRPGSRLDRASRGVSCPRCMQGAALDPAPPRQDAQAGRGEADSGRTGAVLMTEPYDGHEATATCPGCPHTITLDDLTGAEFEQVQEAARRMEGR